jgi:hypothetical protein
LLPRAQFGKNANLRLFFGVFSKNILQNFFTDFAIFQTIKQAAGRDVNLTVCAVTTDTPDIYEKDPPKYRLRNASLIRRYVDGA